MGIDLNKAKAIYSGPMSAAQIAYLRDLQAAVDNAIENGLGFQSIVAALRSDMNEFRMDEYDVEKSLKRGVSPWATDYANAQLSSVGEPGEDFE